MGSVLGEGHFVVLLLVMVSLTVSTVNGQPKSILLNCGSDSSVNVDGRRWVGDMATDNNVTHPSPIIQEVWGGGLSGLL